MLKKVISIIFILITLCGAALYFSRQEPQPLAIDAAITAGKASPLNQHMSDMSGAEMDAKYESLNLKGQCPPTPGNKDAEVLCPVRDICAGSVMCHGPGCGECDLFKEDTPKASITPPENPKIPNLLKERR